jgi:CubicO group peptidase (beta-lactamase class C family)
VPGAEAHTILEYLPAIGPAGHAHGERFHYATPNTDLLGLCVERAADAPLADVIARELWGPLGAERDAELTVDPAGTAAIGGGFCATLRDYARLARLVQEGGFLPRAWLAELGHGAVPDAATASGASGYGSQWWLRDGHPMARGIHGQLITAGVTVLSSWPAAVDPAREAEHRGLIRGLLLLPYTWPAGDGGTRA